MPELAALFGSITFWVNDMVGIVHKVTAAIRETVSSTGRTCMSPGIPGSGAKHLHENSAIGML